MRSIGRVPLLAFGFIVAALVASCASTPKKQPYSETDLERDLDVLVAVTVPWNGAQATEMAVLRSQFFKGNFQSVPAIEYPSGELGELKKDVVKKTVVAFKTLRAYHVKHRGHSQSEYEAVKTKLADALTATTSYLKDVAADAQPNVPWHKKRKRQ